MDEHVCEEKEGEMVDSKLTVVMSLLAKMAAADSRTLAMDARSISTNLAFI